MFPIVSLKTVTSLTGMRASTFSGDGDCAAMDAAQTRSAVQAAANRAFMLRVSAVHAWSKRVDSILAF
jgi:hypothetical protein